MSDTIDANLCLALPADQIGSLPHDLSVAAPPDERDLIQRAASDPAAFSHLYRAHCRSIANYLQRRTGDAHVTEDLLSETFLNALRGLPQWSRRTRGVPLRFWLLRIATNVANRWLKREARQRRRRDTDRHRVAISSTPPASADELTRALRALPVDWQAVLMLHHVEGLDMSQVASVLNCREGTVKSRLFRARAALRVELDRAERKDRP